MSARQAVAGLLMAEGAAAWLLGLVLALSPVVAPANIDAPSDWDRSEIAVRGAIGFAVCVAVGLLLFACGKFMSSGPAPSSATISRMLVGGVIGAHLVAVALVLGTLILVML